MDNIYDLIILGSGPAGLTAGIYAGRSDLKILIITKGKFGSLSKAHKIDNYPGISDGISGAELNDEMEKQCRKFNAEFIIGTVLDFDFSNEIKIVKTSSGNYSGKYIVVATGNFIGASKIKGEQKFVGNGVSYCATCDGAFTKGLNAALFGKGDEVGQEALFLSKFSNSIKIFVNSHEFNCKEDLKRAILSDNKIEIILNTELVEIIGSEYVEKILVKTKKAKDAFGKNLEKNEIENFFYEIIKENLEETREYPMDFVFMYLGTKNNKELYGGYFDLDNQGFIITDNLMKTKIENVYAVGDVRSKEVRQITTAVNDGTIAALEIIKRSLKR
jgi:thioredoxin reductase (NADPH)